MTKWKMSSTSVMVLLHKNVSEKWPQKALRSFWEKSKELKNVLKKRYGLSEKKWKTGKTSVKSVKVFLEEVKYWKIPSKGVTDLNLRLQHFLKLRIYKGGGEAIDTSLNFFLYIKFGKVYIWTWKKFKSLFRIF